MCRAIVDISGKGLKYGNVREEEKRKTTKIICGFNEGGYAVWCDRGGC